MLKFAFAGFLQSIASQIYSIVPGKCMLSLFCLDIELPADSPFLDLNHLFCFINDIFIILYLNTFIKYIDKTNL